MTTLAQLTDLSDHLILDGLETADGVVVDQQRTLTGVSHLTVGVNQGGRILTLRGEYHFTLAEATAIKALEGAGQPVNLVHHRGTFTVQIVSAKFEPARDRANPQTDAWYSGVITMIEV